MIQRAPSLDRPIIPVLRLAPRFHYYRNPGALTVDRYDVQVMRRFLMLAFLSFCFVGSMASQVPTDDAQPSLAEIARQNREQKKPKSKTVITDETIAASKGPIPEIRVDGTDNSKEIIEDIGRFKAKHTIQETESAVRDWYESEDSQLAYEISNANIQNGSSWARYYGSQDKPPTTAKQSNERALTQARAYEVDRRSAALSGEIRAHLQTRLSAVRTGILRFGLSYDWFKVRCGNGDCSY
jgi:hypothetical protein